MPSAIADDTFPKPGAVRGSLTFPLHGANGHNRSNSLGSSSSGSAEGFTDGTVNGTASSVSSGDRPHNAPRSSSRRIPNYTILEDDVGGPRSGAYTGAGSRDDDPNSAAFPRLSRPVELMRSSYDCVVIGSGYGGGVAASRMARAGESVCVLERGKERWPGEYPDQAGDALEQVHCSGEFAPSWLPGKLVKGGDPTGMYHLIFGNGQNAVVCNG